MALGGIHPPRFTEPLTRCGSRVVHLDYVGFFTMTVAEGYLGSPAPGGLHLRCYTEGILSLLLIWWVRRDSSTEDKENIADPADANIRWIRPLCILWVIKKYEHGVLTGMCV